jgi:5,10-methylenetetrahydrofolate reductase
MDYANVAGKAEEEGIQIALELINQIKKYRGQGIHGLHLMPVGWDEVVPRIIKEADLLPKSISIPLASQERAYAH